MQLLLKSGILLRNKLIARISGVKHKFRRYGV